MTDSLDSVNQLARSYRRAATRADDQKVSAANIKWAELLESVATELTELRQKTKLLLKHLGDLSDLPDELLSELSGLEVDELEDQLVSVIKAYEGEADLNQILVGLYRKFKVVQKRRFIQQKLYRMSQRGLVWTVPGRKGHYSTSEPFADAKQLEAATNGESEWTFDTEERRPSPMERRPPAKEHRYDEIDDEIPF